MKRIALLVAVVCLAAAVQAFVCTPNFCANVKCACDNTEENCNGEFQPNGGTCGCCPLCVTRIPAGGSCFSFGIGGPPPSSQCAIGTVCLDGICQLIDRQP